MSDVFGVAVFDFRDPAGRCRILNPATNRMPERNPKLAVNLVALRTMNSMLLKMFRRRNRTRERDPFAGTQ
jgi:hypothetical protein